MAANVNFGAAGPGGGRARLRAALTSGDTTRRRGAPTRRVPPDPGGSHVTKPRYAPRRARRTPALPFYAAAAPIVSSGHGGCPRPRCVRERPSIQSSGRAAPKSPAAPAVGPQGLRARVRVCVLWHGKSCAPAARPRVPPRDHPPPLSPGPAAEAKTSALRRERGCPRRRLRDTGADKAARGGGAPEPGPKGTRRGGGTARRAGGSAVCACHAVPCRAVPCACSQVATSLRHATSGLSFFFFSSLFIYLFAPTFSFPFHFYSSIFFFLPFPPPPSFSLSCFPSIYPLFPLVSPRVYFPFY